MNTFVQIKFEYFCEPLNTHVYKYLLYVHVGNLSSVPDLHNSLISPLVTLLLIHSLIG